MPPNKVIDRVAANVRAEMARRSHTQTSLSRLISLSQAGLSRRLVGRVAFDVCELEEIASALDVTVSDLLGQAKASA